MKKKFLILFSLLALLSGCAPKVKQISTDTNIISPSRDEASQKSPTKKNRSDITSWSLNGGVAVKTPKKAWTATLQWQQSGLNHYRIRLSGPLGGGSILLEKKGGTISYKDNQGKQIKATNEAELQKETGIFLPMHQLFYWVRGLPAPGAVQSSKYSNGLLTNLSQSGFHLEYTEYARTMNTQLPTRIKLTGKNTMIKLVIKRWQS